MPQPSPIYLVEYNGTVLPGYCTSEDIPLSLRLAKNSIIGRDGGTMRGGAADLRSFTIRMRVLSRLNSVGGLAHLDDCKEQYRTALAALARLDNPAPLYIGETDRYINCMVSSVSAPLEAPDNKRITYLINFESAQPWFVGTTVSGSTAVSGNQTITQAIGDTRKTYPIITIPTGITHITLTQPSTGKVVTVSGSHASPIIIDCATLQITEAGSNGISYLVSGPDFGMYHQGAGTLTISSSSVVGSGNLLIEMTPRYER